MTNSSKIRKLLSSLLYVSSLMLFQSYESFAQCLMIDRSRDALFISYERVREAKIDGKESANVAVLRLSNNTDCAVYITAGSAERFFKTPPKNSTALERVRREIEYVLPEGALVPDIQYRFATSAGFVKSVGGDMFFDFKLLGKRSLLFEVPLEQLTANYNGQVAVPFRYAWERENRAETYFLSVENTVIFSATNLPEKIKK